MKEAEKLLRLSISFRAKKSWAQTLAINKKKGIFKAEVREPATSLENWQTGIKSLLSQSLHLYIWRTGLNPNLYCLDLTQCKLKYHWFLFQIVISFSGLCFPKEKTLSRCNSITPSWAIPSFLPEGLSWLHAGKYNTVWVMAIFINTVFCTTKSSGIFPQEGTPFISSFLTHVSLTQSCW